MREPIVVGIIGVGFGFALSRMGFSSWDEVHAMFTFSDLRLLLSFMLSVALLTVSWVLIKKTTGASWPVRGVHPGTLVGGALFGVGWALSGACPSIALVQLGEGQLGGLVTLVGIFAGNFVYSIVHERHFRWSTSSCVD
ncbi:MAG: YeeE/YedE family protein [Polyangiaceae bacterium]|jgi:uncharacterized membrane protein YedE/YeeE|nr:YeeE/YedE family protein [Polyangiaceae bacterium]